MSTRPSRWSRRPHAQLPTESLRCGRSNSRRMRSELVTTQTSSTNGCHDLKLCRFLHSDAQSYRNLRLLAVSTVRRLLRYTILVDQQSGSNCSLTVPDRKS